MYSYWISISQRLWSKNWREAKRIFYFIFISLFLIWQTRKQSFEWIWFRNFYIRNKCKKLFINLISNRNSRQTKYFRVNVIEFSVTNPKLSSNVPKINIWIYQIMWSVVSVMKWWKEWLLYSHQYFESDVCIFSPFFKKTVAISYDIISFIIANEDQFKCKNDRVNIKCDERVAKIN